MSLINVITGTENQKEAIAKVHVFHVPTEEGASHEEAYLTKLSRDGSSRNGVPICSKHGAVNIISAVEGVKEEIGGRWFQQTYDIKDGEILKVFALRKAAWNSLQTTANLFVMVRAGAPLIKIKIKLVNQKHSKLKVAEITGRMDILSVEEAEVRGARVNPSFRHTFNELHTSRIFEIEVLEPGTAAKPKITQMSVESEDGETRTIKIRKKGRVIEI